MPGFTSIIEAYNTSIDTFNRVVQITSFIQCPYFILFDGPSNGDVPITWSCHNESESSIALNELDELIHEIERTNDRPRCYEISADRRQIFISFVTS